MQETIGPQGSAVGLSFLRTVNYLLTRYPPEDALHSAIMALRTGEEPKYEEERALYHRVMRLCRTFMGTYDPAHLSYMNLKSVHNLVQGTAEPADQICSSINDLVSIAQKIGGSLRSTNVTG